MAETDQKAPVGASSIEPPSLQDLTKALVKAAKARNAVRQRINKETDFDNRYHALRHEAYLLEVQYGWRELDEAFDAAKRVLRDHYPEVMEAIYNYGEWGP